MDHLDKGASILFRKTYWCPTRSSHAHKHVVTTHKAEVSSLIPLYAVMVLVQLKLDEMLAGSGYFAAVKAGMA